jgi:hypothetical protein
VTVAGTGFPVGDVANTELWIEGIKQETVDVQATSATFEVTDVPSNFSSDIKFYTAEGLPTGEIAYQYFTPALVSVTPQIGSSGGTLLTVRGVGFGTATAGLNLYHVVSGQNICSSVEVIAYGTFTCQTIAVTIAGADEL